MEIRYLTATNGVDTLQRQVDKALRSIFPNAALFKNTFKTTTEAVIRCGDSRRTYSTGPLVLSDYVYEFPGEGSALARFCSEADFPMTSKSGVVRGYCAGELYLMNMSKGLICLVDALIPSVKR